MKIMTMMMQLLSLSTQGTLLVVVVVVVASVGCIPSGCYLPIDCDDIYRHDESTPSGVYTIFPGGPTTPLMVFCDMETAGGKWTVIQRRMDGTENFYRPWAHYKAGFGNVAGEYWLGLENILLLTMRKENELRVDMEDWEGNTAWASYSSFSIESEQRGYQLHLGSFLGGDAGDSLSSQDGANFTTYDRDQDHAYTYNCAQKYLGACWYKECFTTNFNGMFTPHYFVYENAQIIWQSWKGWNSPLKSIALKIRSVDKCH